MIKSFLLLLPLIWLQAGCTFQRAWKQAAHISVSQGLEGRWEGRWVSDVNGHKGKLRCIIHHKQDDIYGFLFWATYGRGLRVSYTAEFQIIPNDNGFVVSGKKDLGRFGGGLYLWKGSIQKNQFQATYTNQHALVHVFGFPVGHCFD